MSNVTNVTNFYGICHPTIQFSHTVYIEQLFVFTGEAHLSVICARQGSSPGNFAICSEVQ